tara:strand:- start:523 stop:1716 length:1194 start_codon:yes stop_codon:yes gene_type:complete
MNTKVPIWILKIISISIGFSGTFFILELCARILPASEYLFSELPLSCKDPINPDKNCIFRRASNRKTRFTKGKFPPFSHNTFKSTNDIGQFSNFDFKDIRFERNNFQNVLTIGDSFVEAIQIPNEDTFHGRLNLYETNSGNTLISTSIGSSGNAFPQYLIHIFYAKKNIDLQSTILIIPIIVNDFDESLEKYLIHSGAFFTSEDPFKIGFKERILSNEIKLKRTFISISALSRYLYFNINFYKTLNFSLCKLKIKNCDNFKNLGSNLAYSSEKSQQEKFQNTKISSDVFLDYLKNIRTTKSEKNKTLFILDTHRKNIYNSKSNRDYYFDLQKRYFIKQAKNIGFKVIDMDKIFRNHYRINGNRFEFINDGHWNSIAHEIITDQIANIYNLQKIKNSK